MRRRQRGAVGRDESALLTTSASGPVRLRRRPRRDGHHHGSSGGRGRRVGGGRSASKSSSGEEAVLEGHEVDEWRGVLRECGWEARIVARLMTDGARVEPVVGRGGGGAGGA